MNRIPALELNLAIATWLLLVPSMSSCGTEAQIRTASPADSSPPECVCCLMNEAPSGLGHQRGEYEIDTIEPAPYPDGTTPAHIHVIVRAPTQEHCSYVADFVFEDDPLNTRLLECAVKRAGHEKNASKLPWHEKRTALAIPGVPII